ncbi:MAG: ABC transporter permease [Planctomycetota bacterium JB042]
MNASKLLRLAGPFAGLLLVLVLFRALAGESFLSAYNLKTVLTQTVIVGLGAVGMTFVIVAGGIDLSVGSVIALASVVTAWFLREGFDPVTAASCGVLTGAACGLVNGLVVTSLRIVPFIVTLGMLGVARGAAKWIGDEQKIDAPASGLGEWMSKTPDPPWLVFAPGVWLMFGLAALMAFVLRRTVLGVRTFAIGSNEEAARLCGVPVARTKVWLYVLCGAFAGLAGVMQFGRLTVGDPTTAIGKELDVIAAVVIGGGSLAGGEGSILGAIVGAFLMSFLANGCTLAGVPNYVQEMIVGGIIVAAVAVDRLRHGRGAARG